MATVLSMAAMLVMAVDIQILPSILTRLGGSQVQLGLLLSSLFFLYPVASAGSGWISDRLGKRRVLAAGALLIAVSFGAAAPFASPWARIAAVLFFGAGSGILEGQSTALLADLHPGRERPILNLSQLFYCVGATGGPLLVALALTLAPSIGAGALLAAAAGVGFLLFLGFLLPLDSRASAPAAAPVSLRALAADREWRLLAVSLFLYVASEMGTAGWVAQYGKEYLGMSEAAAPVCLTVFWGGAGVARILAVFGRSTPGGGSAVRGGSPPDGTNAVRGGGTHGSAARRRWSPLAMPARPLLLGSAALTLAGQVVAFTAPSAPVAIVGLAAAGLGMGAVWPTLVSIAGARFRDSSGMGVGVLIAVGATAVPVVQPLIGALSQPGVLGLRFTLLALAATTLANLFLLSRVREPAPRW